MRLVAFLLWLAGVAMAAPVHAHAVLEETVPADRAVLAEAPARIVLRFNEPVRAVATQILDQDGRRVAGDEVQSINEELRIAVPRALAAGTYLVSYRVISADAHPVSGSFLFAIGEVPKNWAEPAPKAKPPVHWPALAAIDRAIFLAAALVAAGGVIFLLLFRRDERQSWVVLSPILYAAALLAGVAAVLSVGLQGALIAGAGSGALLDRGIWHLGAQSTRGSASTVAIIGLALVAVSIARVHRSLAVVGVAILIAGFALSGHAATAMPRWIAVPILLLHATGAVFWLGSFVPLLKTLDDHDEAATTFRQFSSRAVVVVPLLLIAGAGLAILQVQHLEGLLATNYGVTLLLKIGLVALLVSIAALNRWSLTPRLASARPTAASWLRMTIRAELLLGFAILVMTAILSQAVPPRSVASHDAHHHDAELSRERYAVATMRRGRMAVIEIEPARAGRNTIDLYLTDASGQPVSPLGIEIEFSNPAAGIAPLRRKLVHAQPGRYQYAGPELALAGRWTLRIDALITDFDKLIFETEIAIR